VLLLLLKVFCTISRKTRLLTTHKYSIDISAVAGTGTGRACVSLCTVTSAAKMYLFSGIFAGRSHYSRLGRMIITSNLPPLCRILKKALFEMNKFCVLLYSYLEILIQYTYSSF
jgi:hypothetical protein